MERSRQTATAPVNACDFTALRRRAFLGRSGLGLLALSSLINHAAPPEILPGARWPGVASPPHHAPRAKRIIWL